MRLYSSIFFMDYHYNFVYGIVTVDHTRVLLRDVLDTNVAGSDYINANHICVSSGSSLKSLQF